jgi:hypothetical protein
MPRLSRRRCIRLAGYKDLLSYKYHTGFALTLGGEEEAQALTGETGKIVLNLKKSPTKLSKL